MSNYWQIEIVLPGLPLSADNTNTGDDTAKPFGDTEDIREVIAQILFEQFSCEGVVIEEETFKDFKSTGKSNGIIAFFSQLPDLDKVKTAINENITEKINFELKLTQIEEKDWSEEWKKQWQPTKISEKIVICPTWREYNAKENEITVNINPGMAFGTGTHETTQLCVRAMEKYMPQNAEIADIGCGSGILAICGVKLGAKNAVAVDIDESVIQIAKDNATLNNVEDKIKIFNATASDLIGKTYDFICANILHNVLDDIMNELKQLLKTNGKMVLSGILNEKEQVVLDAIKREKLNITERMTSGNWVGLVVEL